MKNGPNKTVARFRRDNPKPFSAKPPSPGLSEIFAKVQSGEWSVEQGARAVEDFQRNRQ